MAKREKRLNNKYVKFISFWQTYSGSVFDTPSSNHLGIRMGVPCQRLQSSTAALGNSIYKFRVLRTCVLRHRRRRSRCKPRLRASNQASCTSMQMHWLVLALLRRTRLPLHIGRAHQRARPSKTKAFLVATTRRSQGLLASCAKVRRGTSKHNPKPSRFTAPWRSSRPRAWAQKAGWEWKMRQLRPEVGLAAFKKMGR